MAKKTKPADTAPPANESPHDRFLRLAPPRTEAALKRIELLGNLAGPGYQYDKAEAQQILDALFDSVHDLKRKFEKATKPKGGGFTFAAPKIRANARAE